MKVQHFRCKVKPNFICLFAGLVLIGLLAVAGASLAADDNWERKENMPESSRCCVGAASVGGKVYVIGGIEVNRAPHLPNPGDMTLDRVQEYDPASNTWTAKGICQQNEHEWPLLRWMERFMCLAASQSAGARRLTP